MRKVVASEFISLDGVVQAPATPTTRPAGSDTAAGTPRTGATNWRVALTYTT
jgi:hypothetical protein